MTMLLFLAGIVLSLIGSLPPGLISLSVAQTAMLRGFWPAIIFGLGAAVAEFFQALGAVIFADWFLQHPAAAKAFELGAIPIFLGLFVYLWFFAKAPRTTPTDTPVVAWRQFTGGVAVSIFNLLAIPYWVAYAGWLRLNGWWEEGHLALFAFALGVTVGTMLALGLYAWLAQELTQRSEWAAKVANRLVALIFLGLGLRLLYGQFF